MGEPFKTVAKVFVEIVDEVAKHPKEVAAVAAVAGAACGGYGMGYRDARKDADESYEKRRAAELKTLNG